jgi:hypothetical protein
MVEHFLNRFVLSNESSANDHIDLMIMIKAIPNKILEDTVTVVELFNFRVI